MFPQLHSCYASVICRRIHGRLGFRISNPNFPLASGITKYFIYLLQDVTNFMQDTGSSNLILPGYHCSSCRMYAQRGYRSILVLLLCAVANRSVSRRKSAQATAMQCAAEDGCGSNTCQPVGQLHYRLPKQWNLHTCAEYVPGSVWFFRQARVLNGRRTLVLQPLSRQLLRVTRTRLPHAM